MDEDNRLAGPRIKSLVDGYHAIQLKIGEALGAGLGASGSWSVYSESVRAPLPR